jgi:hypothetical protein
MYTQFYSENMKGRDLLSSMNGYKNNIREDSREAEYEGVDWIYVFRS